ncbi:MAG: radical SAM protein [Candidatus Altiarchaeota archaeon]|nr:radical SAM protein [Candidatus Altiarchaeota archaeon]
MNKAHAIIYLLYLELKRRIFGTKFMAEVDVTDNCNLRCKYCYHWQKKDFQKEEPPIGMWEKRFKELHKSGIRSILLVGGEPALRMDVLMLADKMFPFVHIITNGTIKVPKEFNHRLFVSVDGLEKTNDSIRGKGVFSRIMNNYQGDNRVIINMTLSNDNYKELEGVVKIAEKQGFRGVVCNIYGHAIGDKGPITLRKEERKLIIDELKRVKSLHPNGFLLSKAMISWYEKGDHRGRCYWGDDALHFDVSWKRRRCFASNADCSECGCLAGAFQSFFTMVRYPKEVSAIIG